MKIDLVPLLQIQRDLFAMPRFRTSVSRRTCGHFCAPDGTLSLPPLVAMNPMARPQCGPPRRLLGAGCGVRRGQCDRGGRLGRRTSPRGSGSSGW